MNRNNARENTLNKITEALREPVGKPFVEEEGTYSKFSGDQNDLEARFSEEFTMLNGKIIVCAGKKDLLDNLLSLMKEKKWKNISCQIPALLKDLQLVSLPFNINGNKNEAEVGITDCECLVARTGTILLCAGQSSGRILPVYTPVHIVIATVSQLVYDISDAIDHIKNKFQNQLPSALFFASGPSRTGDIERTLVIGVHGPMEVYVFLINDKDPEA